MTVRELVRARLAELSWSESDLARACGLPRQNINMILAGLRPLTARHVLLFDTILALSLDLSQARATRKGE